MGKGAGEEQNFHTQSCTHVFTKRKTLRTHSCGYAHTRPNTETHRCTCTYRHIHTCRHSYTCIQTHLHTDRYIHTHTQVPALTDTDTPHSHTQGTCHTHPCKQPPPQSPCPSPAGPSAQGDSPLQAPVPMTGRTSGWGREGTGGGGCRLDSRANWGRPHPLRLSWVWGPLKELGHLLTGQPEHSWVKSPDMT